MNNHDNPPATSDRPAPGLDVSTGSAPYAARDAMQLDHDGGYYYRHVHAMTQYGLHSKSDIAAELGFRDRHIDHLKAVLKAAQDFVSNVEAGHVYGAGPVRDDGCYMRLRGAVSRLPNK